MTPHQARALTASLARKAEEAIATDMTADYLDNLPAAVPASTSATRVITTTNITSVTYQLPDQNQNIESHQLDGSDPVPSYQYDQNFDGPQANRPGQHFDTDYQRPSYPQPKGKSIN